MKGEESCGLVEIRDYDEYLELLDAVRPFTAFIAIVQIDGYDPDDIVMLEADATMESVGRYKVNKWPGTRTRGMRAQLHMYKSNREFFKWLREGDAFFYNSQDAWGCDLVERTDFGLDDIIFLDKEQEVMMFTTTHEGIICINEELI